MKTFRGDRLKFLREERNTKLTQKELAKMIGCKDSAISKYENGQRKPSPEIIIKLVNVFGVSADFLLGTDHLIKTAHDNQITYEILTKEELEFIKILRNDKSLYLVLLNNPHQGYKQIKTKVNF